MASGARDRALVAGGVLALGTAAVASVALANGALPDSITVLVIPPACAAAIGAAAGLGWAIGWPMWSRRAVATASFVATLAGVVTAGWFLSRPSLGGLAATGLQTVGDSVFLLPGLLAWNAVRRPGAILLGLCLTTMVEVVVAGLPFASLALLAAPVVAAPAEAWFLTRPGRSVRGRGMVGAGIILGLSSAAATRLIHPGAAADWGSLLVGRALAGLMAGLLAARFGTVSFEWLRRAEFFARASARLRIRHGAAPVKPLP